MSTLTPPAPAVIVPAGIDHALIRRTIGGFDGKRRIALAVPALLLVYLSISRCPSTWPGWRSRPGWTMPASCRPMSSASRRM